MAGRDELAGSMARRRQRALGGDGRHGDKPGARRHWRRWRATPNGWHSFEQRKQSAASHDLFASLSWSSLETDPELQQAKVTLDPAARLARIAGARRIVTQADVWLSIAREHIRVASAMPTEGCERTASSVSRCTRVSNIRVTR